MDITATGIRNALSALAASQQGFSAEDGQITASDNEKDLLVKVSAPIYIRVIPPPALASNSPASSPSSSRSTSEVVENFMSTWTRLVGDPVLSKWIVMVLAVSVSLNGYLLKGIAAGLAGRGVGGKEGVRFTASPVIEKTETLPEEKEPEVEAVVAPTAIAPKPAHTSGLPTFMLESVDHKLKAQRLSSASSSDSSLSSDSDTCGQKEMETITRSLEECVDIFENGPKPVSVSLSLLNDEEVVMLAQSGKVAAYALEKVLGDLERAVRIRRALICKCSCGHHFYLW